MNIVAVMGIALMNSLWQAALLAALIHLGLRLATRINAATRFAIWWAALGVTVMLPFAPRFIEFALASIRPDTMKVSQPVFVPTLPPMQLFGTPPLVTVNRRPTAVWPYLLAGAWTFVLLCRLIQIVRSFVFLRRVKRRAYPSSGSLPPTGRDTLLLISSEVDSPIAVGFLRPAIILPASFREALSPEELEHVLLHEAAHVARRDDWNNLLARILSAVMSLHPVALWILRRIDIERESACDDWAVYRTQSASRYARTLARLFDLRLASSKQEALLAPGVLGGSVFARRIEMLFRCSRDFAPRISAAPLGALLAILVVVGTVVSLLPPWIAFAQAPRPAFDVASIKRTPERTDEAGIPVQSGGTFAARPGGRLEVRNNPISNVINNAYGIALYQLFGAPDWVTSERYDMDAKGPAESSRKDIMLMAQTLLVERFAMKAHFETREMPAYILTVAKGGVKMHFLNSENCVPRDSTTSNREQPPNVCGNNQVTRNRGWTATRISMPGVTGVLAMALRGPVIDKTGIQGTFDVSLRWSDDLATAPSDDPDAPPTLSTALRDTLGLEVKRGRGPVEVLVIDHIERPTSN